MARAPIKFDRQAVILAPVETRDADGGPVTTYAPTKSVWCHRHDMTSREVRVANALRSETTAIFTFRWFSGLTPKHRIECEGVTYEIDPPKEIGRRQYLEVSAFDRPGQ